METERERLLQAEQRRLRDLYADINSDWRQVRYLFGITLAAIPIGMRFGLAAGIIVLVLALSFVATAAYLIGVRREEYRASIREIDDELTMLRDPDYEEPRRKSTWRPLTLFETQESPDH